MLDTGAYKVEIYFNFSESGSMGQQVLRRVQKKTAVIRGLGYHPLRTTRKARTMLHRLNEATIVPEPLESSLWARNYMDTGF